MDANKIAGYLLIRRVHERCGNGDTCYATWNARLDTHDIIRDARAMAYEALDRFEMDMALGIAEALEDVGRWWV